MGKFKGKQPAPQDTQLRAQPKIASQHTYAPTGQQWSEWSLDPDQQYYYRARYVSYDDFISSAENERNKIRPDGQGQYVHYQFMSFQEAEAGYAAQRHAPVYAAQNGFQTPDHDDGASGSSGTSEEANNSHPRVVMTLERTSDGVKISLPDSSSHTVVLDKKSQKKLRSDKKKKVNPRAKVHRWLEEW